MSPNRPPNRLAQETSPYLQQHAHNPVDWYPWGEEAFEKARLEDKPVLLSVGYSACHWCHVMAHESFENEEIAAVMNREFLCVKVDREERPDVDAIYMNAVQAMTGAGGWPMTVVMRPDGKPFFGGTYYPPEDRYGRPGFKRVLFALADAWKNRRAEADASAEELTDHLGKLASLPAGEDALSEALLAEAMENLRKRFDARYGGFDGAPKFPPHSVLKFLLARDEPGAWEMAEGTLERMARGGIYDQLGGGFARYSVDEAWLVPHFEKMLYDNAQLAQRYLEAYQRSANALFRETAEGTLDWVRREMLSPEGGFYSALDADSEGEEGKFYLWTEEDFDALLGDDARLAKAYFGVSSMGNFEGKNILTAAHDKETVAKRFGLEETQLESKLSAIKKTLFDAREKRVRPGLDDKILTSWNGLMLAAFADAGRILKRPDYLAIARRNARFVRENLYRDGTLLHSYKDGVAKISGMLEDYAYYALGLIALYRASLESEWLIWALELAESIVTRFPDREHGGFFSTAEDAEALIVRPKDTFDAAMPSGNGATAELLVMLARYSGNAAWEDLAAKAIGPMARALRQQPQGFGSLLCALAWLLAPPREIAIVGDPGAPDTQALLRTVHDTPLPHTILALAEGQDDPLVTKLPFLKGREPLAGKATAYVCEGGSCKLPVTDPGGLEVQLKEQR